VQTRQRKKACFSVVLGTELFSDLFTDAHTTRRGEVYAS
jgi:hypothetical protein